MTKYLVFGQEQFKVGYAMPSVKIDNKKGTGLNLRQEQSTSSPSLGLYKNGSVVCVFGVSQTWCHVKTEDGNIGFMLYNYGDTPYVINEGDKIGQGVPESL